MMVNCGNIIKEQEAVSKFREAFFYLIFISVQTSCFIVNDFYETGAPLAEAMRASDAAFFVSTASTHHYTSLGLIPNSSLKHLEK